MDLPNNIRRDDCWTLSNVTAGNTSQIQTVIDAGLFPKLVNNVINEQDQDILKESLWTLGNACSGGSDVQIECFVNFGIIPALCRGLELIILNLTRVELEALEYILLVGEKKRKGEVRNTYALVIEEFAGLHFIVGLLRSQDRNVAWCSLQLLGRYFDIDIMIKGGQRVVKSDVDDVGNTSHKVFMDVVDFHAVDSIQFLIQFI